MNRQNCVVVILVIVASVSLLSRPSAAIQPVNPVASRWEYLVVDTGMQVDKGFEAKWNQSGDQGWELVSVSTRSVGGHSAGLIAVFKRPKG